MTPPLVFALLGLGALLVIDRRSEPRVTLRDRAIEAQAVSACASRFARDLTARALKAGY